jgi:phosphate acetyltransferase
LLVAPVAEHSALARTCLGLLRALDRQGVKIAFVKPVAQASADGGPDRSAELVAAVTTLRPPEPFSTSLLEKQLGQGELEVVLEKIGRSGLPVHRRLAFHGRVGHRLV